MEKKNDEKISLANAWKTIKKNILWILLFTVFGITLGAIMVFVVIKPKYESRTSIVVTVSTDNQQGTDINYSDGLRLVQTVSDLVKEDIVLEEVAKRHNESNTIAFANSLRGNIKVDYSTTSFLIVIKVYNRDSKESMILANLIAESLIHVCNTDKGLSKLLQETITQTTLAQEGVYYSPNKTIWLLASMVVGLFVGIVVIFAKESLINVYKTKEDVQKDFDYNVIGTFYNNKKNSGPEYKLKDPNERAFESFNRLFFNVKLLNIDETCKVFMITSTTQGELKTTTIGNLAQAMAVNNKKVLVMDLDLRSPKVHKLFGQTCHDGIVDYIDGSKPFEEIIKKTAVNVDVITAGKPVPNPLIFIESVKMKNALEELKKNYDYILLDTPPLVFSDALAISKISNGVIFNIGMRKAKKSMISDNIKSLKDTNANILGLCLTLLDYDSKTNLQYYYNNDSKERQTE